MFLHSSAGSAIFRAARATRRINCGNNLPLLYCYVIATELITSPIGGSSVALI